MKYVLLITVFFTTSAIKAQWLWDFGGALGASNYLGDIGGGAGTRKDFIADMKLAQTRWNVGGFARVKWRPRLSWKFAFDYLRLAGDDKLSTNPGRQYRNFNFKNDVYDLSTTAHFYFYEDNDIGNTYRYRNSFRAYVFLGIGACYTNPKSLYQGQWVPMQPYASEGTVYRKFIMNIPMGVGFYFTYNKRNRIGFEMNYRKTFSDYLDDISGNYPSTPPPTAYERGLVLRTTELNREDNVSAYDSHTWGMKRGDPSHKDSFVTMSVTYSRVIRGKASFHRVKGGNFFGPKRKGRKIRAKF